MPDKKYIMTLQNGRRRKGNPPRYVSSVKLVRGDIVIHTSVKPVPISWNLALAARSAFVLCSNLDRYFQIFLDPVPDQEVSGND